MPDGRPTVPAVTWWDLTQEPDWAIANLAHPLRHDCNDVTTRVLHYAARGELERRAQGRRRK